VADTLLLECEAKLHVFLCQLNVLLGTLFFLFFLCYVNMLDIFFCSIDTIVTLIPFFGCGLLSILLDFWY
jgi:hypothetical protein